MKPTPDVCGLADVDLSGAVHGDGDLIPAGRPAHLGKDQTAILAQDDSTGS